ncbi:MAG: LysR family transcriptional regulator [uncultured Thiotrichaceae bacterium]|uniref:LysR family transcriptional regulator n=1 Tax=uncultured Thiotrichaceae bacterium TaxID=298394 RepID=A0A6S6SSY6_9GAMM|nr:MAG: LysR family transcriptional regulator [uncultured Thiotrichaceae bacterium]
MSKASEVLLASQPTISLQIKTLEEQIAVKLFERHGPKLNLTTEGEILYDIVQPLVLGIDHIKDTFEAQYGDLSIGQLTITAEESTILYILPKPLQSFASQYPGIRLKIANVAGDDGHKMLMSESADISICSLLTVPKDVEYHPFISFDPVLIAPIGHPITKIENVTLNDIGQYGLVLPSTHFSSWRLVKMVFALNGVNYKIVLETGGWEVVKRFVSIGMGLSIVTRLCLTEEDEGKFAVIPLDKYFPVRKYGYAIRKGKSISAPAARFLEVLNANYKTPQTDLT